MDGGSRSSNSLNSGYSWSIFEEKAREHEPVASNQSHKNTHSPTTGRLCKEDMAIYGTEPAVDHLSLVVCTDCNRVVKSQALVKHKELYHTELHLAIPGRPSPVQTIGLASGSSDVPTSTSTTTSFSGSAANPTLGSVDFSSMASSNHGFLASGLPLRETGQKKKSTTRDYDPEHHCGVWCEEEGKHCLRSLTCKIHPTSQKAKVAGRSKPFGQLLELHRQRKELKKKGRDQQPHPPGTSPLRSPKTNSQSSSVGAHSPTTIAPSASITDDWFGERDSTHTETRACIQAEPLPGDITYPRPLAACAFNSRLVLGNAMFSRRLRSIHTTLLTSVERRITRKGRESLTGQRTKLKNYSRKHHHVTNRTKATSSTSQTFSGSSSTKRPDGLHRSVPLFGVILKETRLPNHMIHHMTSRMAGHLTDHMTDHMISHPAGPRLSNAQVLSGREAPPTTDVQSRSHALPHGVASEEGGRETRVLQCVQPGHGDVANTRGYVDGISSGLSNGPNHLSRYAIPKMHSINGMMIPASAPPPTTPPSRSDSPQQFQLGPHLLHRPPQSPQDGYPPHSLVNSLSARISRLLPLAPSISSICQSPSPHHSSQQTSSPHHSSQQTSSPHHSSQQTSSPHHSSQQTTSPHQASSPHHSSQQTSSPHQASSPHHSSQQQQSAFNFASSRPTPPPSPLTQQQLLAPGPSAQQHNSNPLPGLPGVYVLHPDQAGRQPLYHGLPQDQGRQYVLSQQNHHQEALRHNNLYHLGNGTLPATVSSTATENAQMLNRTFLTHHHQQQQQQQQQQQLFQVPGGRLPPFPALHQLGPMRPHGAVVSGRYTVGSANVPPSVPGQLTPVMGGGAAAAMVGRVRAPVPSSSPIGQDGVPAAPRAYGQSHLQSNPALPQRTHPPSQQVT